MLPLEITIRDIENTAAIDTKIRKKAEKLQLLYDRITYCRVVVETPQKNKHQGKEFQVNIEVDVPGKVLVVNNNSHRNEDLYVAIRDSFNAMKRQLEDHAQRIRGNKKTHQQQLTGKVVRLFPDYGFIETLDGNEYYFHEANVVLIPFSDLMIGSAVRFLENDGGESLQAHQVTATSLQSWQPLSDDE
jgi:ribosomal subunit interface protein